MADEAPQAMHPSFVNVIRQKERVRKNLGAIKHKIGVYSAKGGVGKTTTAVNIAYSLKKRGLSVGLLDADIDCPNITMFLGIEEQRIDTSMGYPLKPIIKDGIKVTSTAMLIDEVSKPVIWRGPMIAKMLGEFFENTDWGVLDYLIIDLPPGSSDSPLTIMQLLELDGFVIVTTPQRIAGINSIRSGMMAKRLNAPIIGVVENMSTGTVSESTKRVIESLGTTLLGTVMLSPQFNSMSDSGKIPVVEDNEIARQYDTIAEGIIKDYDKGD